MKTICIMNLKGGVGKTVTAINLAFVMDRSVTHWMPLPEPQVKT